MMKLETPPGLLLGEKRGHEKRRKGDRHSLAKVCRWEKRGQAQFS